MSRFEYTLPSGSRFQVTGPAEASQLQADRIFYEQVASGSLLAYQPGQTLSSLATKITKFDLSRLDRGTAGVDTVAVLSIVQNLPVISGIPDLVNTPVQNPIDQADLVLAKGAGLGSDAVGPLSAFQVQTLQAQMVNLVDQPFDQITQEKGIGKYGMNCLQLEQAGYVKPGTWAKYLASNPANFVSVMNTPGIWTGLNGINTLDDLLLDENSQNTVQNQLMQLAYNALTATGTISNVPQPGLQLSQGQIFTAQGLQTSNALNILGGNAGLLTNILGQARTVSNTLATGAIADAALNLATLNVTNRITGNVGALIANASKFGSIATTAWAKSGGVPSLGNILNPNINLPTLGNININQITGSLTNLVPGSVGNLKATLDNFAKASQFSLNFTNPLASVGNINVQGLASRALGNVQGQITGAVANLQGQITGAVANAQALAQGSLSQLTNLFSGSGDLVSGRQIAAGFSNTVNRQTLDGAVVRILGNSKIPVPGFGIPSPAQLGQQLDIAQAQNVLQGLKQQGAQVLNQVSQLQEQASRVAGQATRIAGQATATFNRITG